MVDPHVQNPDKINEPHRAERMAHWNNVATKMGGWKRSSNCYHRRLARVYQQVVAPGLRVLEVGCAYGDLLAALKPADGVGIDFSSEMISRAQQRHPELRFIQADAHELELEGTFDVIILSDLVNDLTDVQAVLERLSLLSTPKTRLILNLNSQAWRLPLTAARKLNLATRLLPQNWLTVADVSDLLYLTDFEVIKTWQEILCPLPIPLLKTFFNNFLVKIWPFSLATLTNFILARPMPKHDPEAKEALVSVIVPARNEAGNIENIFARTPEMGSGTELVFVEGHSSDNTYETIEKAIQAHPERRCKLLRQPGKGKGDAVRAAFDQASGDVLMILDADLTVPPEDLPRFYEALHSGKADFVNGVRLVYPMEKRAMRYFNLLGNKFFSLAFSWLLGQPIKDTLCGTKVLWKSDYERITANRAHFGDFDPFGDFDLIFGAVKQNLRIVDLPIRYRERTYGDTNIQRWKHGVLLLKMVIFAARRIKFL